MAKKAKEEMIDTSLFASIQPQGGITFREPSFMQMGDGYVRCLHLYSMPNHLSSFWLIHLFSQNNAICNFDVSTKDLREIKKNLNKSIIEENARSFSAKNYMELYDAEKRKNDLQALYNEVSSMGEVIKVCDFRIFVRAATIIELEERCEQIFKDLEADNFVFTTLLNEQKAEWASLFENSGKTHSKPFALKGLSLTTEQLASGYPFNYSELLDPQGSLLGYSETGGAIIFDEFTKTKRRAHYNSIVCGDLGSGKSTYLKKRFKANASIGNFVRVFDASGEFTNLTKEFGGKVIKCNGSEGMLNPLEILKTGEDDYTSYSNHVSKLQSFFKCIIPSLSDETLQEFANHLRSFYEEYDLVPDDYSEITGRDAKEYPTLSDFKEYLQKTLKEIQDRDSISQTDVETQLNIVKAQTVNVILSAVTNLCSNYNKMFDGHSTINNITMEKVVSFDISAIKDLGNIFTAQMQNLLSLCWDNAVTNGLEAKSGWENDLLAPEEITKFIILIDEAHRFINTSMPLILDMVIKYEREARKYFTGFTLASQSVRDFMPEVNSEGVDKIRVLFELSQYKLMFKQDSSAKEHIKRVFGEGLTISQIDQIPFLEQGNCIMAISGDKSIKFKVWLSKEYEEALFAGGR